MKALLVLLVFMISSTSFALDIFADRFNELMKCAKAINMGDTNGVIVAFGRGKNKGEFHYGRSKDGRGTAHICRTLSKDEAGRSLSRKVDYPPSEVSNPRNEPIVCVLGNEFGNLEALQERIYSQLISISRKTEQSKVSQTIEQMQVCYGVSGIERAFEEASLALRERASDLPSHIIRKTDN